MYFHDAIELYAVALNKTLKKGGNITDGRAIISAVVNSGILFTGETSELSDYMH